MPEREASAGFEEIGEKGQICFSCQPGVACFTECCRDLDLMLTPYDVLRLKQRLGLSSRQFLAQYVIVEWEEGQSFPLCYLSMVDDGRASCVFVGKEGCGVYTDRPGSCRAYPLGRGVSLNEAGAVHESLILLREEHCQGFAAGQEQSTARYLHDQGFQPYQRYNDALLPLLQHPHVRNNRQFQLSKTQAAQYMLALYDLDRFREQVISGGIVFDFLDARQIQGLAGADEELLLVGIQWLMREFFGDAS